LISPPHVPACTVPRQRLCQELDGLSQPTFDRYLSYLERAFLVFTLPNYSRREGAVQRRGRRLYFVDGAVRNAAPRGRTLDGCRGNGALYENLVAGHLHALAGRRRYASITGGKATTKWT